MANLFIIYYLSFNFKIYIFYYANFFCFLSVKNKSLYMAESEKMLIYDLKAPKSSQNCHHENRCVPESFSKNVLFFFQYVIKSQNC